MRIDQIEVRMIARPLLEPFRTSFGDDDAIEAIVVRMTGGGHTGWGEGAPWRYPAYSAESARTAFIVARDFLAPRLIGQEIGSGDELQQRLAGIKGNPFAKAAFDLAWWDLHAKQQGQPLWKLIGGESPEVAAGEDFGVLDSLDDLLARIGQAVERQYPRVKLKFRPGWEVEMVAAVRQAYPNLTIHVDCNSAYTLDDAPMFRELDRYGLAMIEQPLMHDDLIDHAELQRQLDTPLCLDESITSPARARKAAQIGACRWVNIKPGRVGGISPALRIHDICRDAGIGCWIGGMLESSVGAMHCVALATLPNVLYPSDIFPTERFWAEDMAEPAMRHSAPGRFRAPSVPGVGAEPVAARLEACTRERAILG